MTAFTKQALITEPQSIPSRSRAIPSKLASEIQSPWQGGNWAEAVFFFNSALEMDGKKTRVLDLVAGPKPKI